LASIEVKICLQWGLNRDWQSVEVVIRWRKKSLQVLEERKIFIKIHTLAWVTIVTIVTIAREYLARTRVGEARACSSE
jgi:hypothetical protein